MKALVVYMDFLFAFFASAHRYPVIHSFAPCCCNPQQGKGEFLGGLFLGEGESTYKHHFNLVGYICPQVFSSIVEVA